ncbi:MAG TPA: (Fe-S)-binding protein [Chloroflexota bacterium]|nr:(Fe-S)-binding protein [Chloroflexota bacterium]
MSIAQRLASPAVQAWLAVTFLGVIVLVFGDLIYDPLRLLGIIIISIGAAAAGVTAGYGAPGERDFVPSVPNKRGIVTILSLACIGPIAATLIWGAIDLLMGNRGGPALQGVGSTPTRQVLFNVDLGGKVAMYALMALPIGFLAFGLTRRAMMWGQGQPENRFDHLGLRVWIAVRDSVMHGRIVRRSNIFGGLMHFNIFWGFIVLLIGTIIVMIESDVTVPLFGFSFYRGNFYLGYKVAMNVAGVMLIAGVLMAYWRRTQKRRTQDTTADDVALLTLLLVLTVQGFALQALRLASVNDPWAGWSFGSYPFSLLFLPVPTRTLAVLHEWTWWTHFATTFLLLGYVAYSKGIHAFTSLANVFFRRLKPTSELEPIANLEEAETFGVGKLEDFTWAQLLSVDACMHCGRCLEYCPTFNTDKPLRPRDLVLEVAGYQADKGGLFSGEMGGDQNYGRARWGKGAERELIGQVVSEDELWDCTTCGACMSQCPVYIEHVPLIVAMRRNLVLEQAKFPDELVPLFNNMEKNFNPWEFPASSRGAWAREMGVKTLAENPTAEILYWVGCYANFDERNNKVARALVKCLLAAKVDFAILGQEEKCSGEPLRRIGNEYLYQTLVGENVATLNGYNVKTVITACPHCFNTIGREYPQFGGNYRVIHHTTFVNELIQSGRLKLKPGAADGAITYHDSCYIGRYHGIYDAPREALSALGGELREMRMNRRTSLCCGGGGGRVFMTESRGAKINHLRLDQALETGAGTVASACPFCLTMLEDAVSTKDVRETIRAKDVVELIAEAIV